MLERPQEKRASRRTVESSLNTISFNNDETVKPYTVSQKKLDTMPLTAGFFASKTIGVDFDSHQAMDYYGMRNEQEKWFTLQKDDVLRKKFPSTEAVPAKPKSRISYYRYMKLNYSEQKSSLRFAAWPGNYPMAPEEPGITSQGRQAQRRRIRGGGLGASTTYSCRDSCGR